MLTRCVNTYQGVRPGEMPTKAARDRMDVWILAHFSYVRANEIKTLAGLMVWNMGYSTGLTGPVRIETSAMKQRSVVAVYLHRKRL